MNKEEIKTKIYEIAWNIKQEQINSNTDHYNWNNEMQYFAETCIREGNRIKELLNKL